MLICNHDDEDHGVASNWAAGRQPSRRGLRSSHFEILQKGIEASHEMKKSAVRILNSRF